MTTTASRTTVSSAPSRTPVVAALGIVASLIATAVGTFWDLSDNEKSNHHSFGEYLFTAGVIAIAAAIVFGLVVRNAGEGNPGRRALILGVVGALSIAVFWAGLPLVLAAGSVACALVERDKLGSLGVGSKVGLALSALTAVFAGVLAVIG